MADKGRTPTEIYNALSINAATKKDFDIALDKVFSKNSNKIKRNPERVKVLLKANKIKINNTYSLKGLYRIALTVLVLGGIVYGLSSKKVNQNEVYGWITLLQGGILMVLFYFVRKKKQYNLLFVALLTYASIWGIELIVWGIPNDLLKAYYRHKIHVPPTYKLQSRTGGARLFGFIFPYIYLAMKAFLGWFVFVAYINHKKYNELPMEIKEELKRF